MTNTHDTTGSQALDRLVKTARDLDLVVTTESFSDEMIQQVTVNIERQKVEARNLLDQCARRSVLSWFILTIIHDRFRNSK